MKSLFTALLLFVSIAVGAQVPSTMQVNTGEQGSSARSSLHLFYLNHVLYIKAFVLSDIYSAVTADEMAFVVKTLGQNLSDGKRTQFIIQTGKKIAYRLAVFVVANNGKEQLVILTNFNPKNGEFEKKIKPDFYATSAEIKNGTVIGNMFELPIENEKKYREENDYIGLINIGVFNNTADSTQMTEWFTLAESTQPKMVNNLNWLKSYYYLTQRDFAKSEEFLTTLKTNVAASPQGEQNQWVMLLKVLGMEIETMKAIEALSTKK